MEIAHRYLRECESSGTPSKAEIICTQIELPTMKHQAFWINYLEKTGANSSDWIYWLAYDDQVFSPGIARLVDEFLNWPLTPQTTYFGPWAMRHESPDHLWADDPSGSMEVWTSFPAEGPLRLTSIDWIAQQLIQPTYMQMSGSIAPLRNHGALVSSWPEKGGPMRIEMATACYSPQVSEFPEPVSIINGRGNSDRASYTGVARREDGDLFVRVLRTGVRDPFHLIHVGWQLFKRQMTLRRQGIRPTEEWRVRGEVRT
jgi:hypothetical protein